MSKLSPTQRRILDIYKTFFSFCQEHDINFCGVAGTAIGAIRHHGFIPWDDDIDVGMPIEDFERFRKLCAKGLPNNLGFIESYWMGGKIYDKNSTIIDIRDLTNFDRYHGVYIDIFPVIGLPDDLEERKKFVADIKAYATNAELQEHYPDVSSFSKKELADWKNHLLHNYDYNTADKVAGFSYFVCDGPGFRNPVLMDFEDVKMPISSAYDWDLTNHFGDYMTPPPKEQQKTHDKYHFLDLDKPYTEYQKEVAALPKWLLDTIKKKQRIEGELTQYSSSLKYMLDQTQKAAPKKEGNKLKNIIFAPLHKIRKDKK